MLTEMATTLLRSHFGGATRLAVYAARLAKQHGAETQAAVRAELAVTVDQSTGISVWAARRPTDWLPSKMPQRAGSYFHPHLVSQATSRNSHDDNAG